MKSREALLTSFVGKDFETCPPPVIKRILLEGLKDPQFDSRLLVDPILSILRLAPVGRLVTESSDWREVQSILTDSDFSQWLEEPLLLGLLEQEVVADYPFEQTLSRIRAACLRSAVESPEVLVPESFLDALATYCYFTDFAWKESDWESDYIHRLLVFSRSNKFQMMVLSCYRPLLELESKKLIMAKCSLAESKILKHQVREPEQESAIRSNLPLLTMVNANSCQVKAQYETNPYPKWRRLRPQRTVLFGEWLRQIQRHSQGTTRWSEQGERPRILVAGCGTGRHPLELAIRHPDAIITAIDLSLASLAYGARKAKELEIENVRFFQADILELREMQGRFHLVEALGVLHHLRDPLEGWKILVDCLDPSGVLHVGYYSELGRESAGILAAQNLIQQLDTKPDIGSLRHSRSLLMLQRKQLGLVDFSDLYSLSAFRDLLLPACESRTDLPQLSKLLDRLGLSCIQLETTSVLREKYRSSFPEKPENDLGAWAEIERMNPKAFSCMYRIYCEKITP